MIYLYIYLAGFILTWIWATRYIYNTMSPGAYTHDNRFALAFIAGICAIFPASVWLIAIPVALVTQDLRR